MTNEFEKSQGLWNQLSSLIAAIAATKDSELPHSSKRPGNETFNASSLMQEIFSIFTKSFDVSGMSTFSSFASQQSEVDKQAASLMGYDDGNVPFGKMDEFSAIETELNKQVSKLSCDLRERSCELGGEGSLHVSYMDSFAQDEGMKKIMHDAKDAGISPLLIEKVQEKLLAEEKSLLGEDGIRFMREYARGEFNPR